MSSQLKNLEIIKRRKIGRAAGITLLTRWRIILVEAAKARR
jgi:hypothetical protein